MTNDVACFSRSEFFTVHVNYVHLLSDTRLWTQHRLVSVHTHLFVVYE